MVRPQHFGILLALMALQFTLVSCSSDQGATGNIGTRPGMTAPDIEGKTIQGEPFELTDLRGKKVIIDFWASWCGPCLRDAPILVSLYDRYGGAEVEVLSIALEKKLDGRSEKIAERLGFDWPHQMIQGISYVRFNDLANAYGVTDIPATFLLDEEGTIILENVGIQEVADYLTKNP